MSEKLQELLYSMFSTLMQVVELAVIFVAVYFVMKFFNVDGEFTKDLTALAFAAVAKFARSYDPIPVKDYVNPEE